MAPLYCQEIASALGSKAIIQLRSTGAISIPDFTFHALRHTWVSRAEEVADGPTVQRMAGHADYRTTLIYTHPDQEKMLDVATILGTRFSETLVNSRIDRR